MFSFNLSKKLQPATKAWKSFKNHLQSKLSNPKFIRKIRALSQRCRVAWRSVFPFIHQKFLHLTKRTPSHYHHPHFRPSYSAIYVDELFPGPMMPLAEPRKNEENMAESSKDISVNKSRPESTIETQNDGTIKIQHVNHKVSDKVPANDEKGTAMEKGKAKAGESSRSSDKWKIPLLPQFRGIDERAEEFIAKFRNDMKLEREQSILEFEEMLKRST